MVRDSETQPGYYCGVVPEIVIWRVATLMIKLHGEHARSQSDMRAEQLAANGDPVGAAVWRRITDAIKQFTSATPSGPLH